MLKDYHNEELWAAGPDIFRLLGSSVIKSFREFDPDADFAELESWSELAEFASSVFRSLIQLESDVGDMTDSVVSIIAD